MTASGHAIDARYSRLNSVWYFLFAHVIHHWLLHLLRADFLASSLGGNVLADLRVWGVQRGRLGSLKGLLLQNVSSRSCFALLQCGDLTSVSSLGK
jgi:hypothetical protein